MKAGACVALAILVSAKLALSPGTVAVTVNAPAIPFAVKLGAVATPATLLAAWATLPIPLKVPEGPVPGAVNVTGRPGSGLPPASLTTTASGVAYVVPTTALCEPPDWTLSEAAGVI